MEGKEIRETVYRHYGQGFHCAEAIAKTVLDRFSKASHSEAIRVASGFGGGIAGSTQELCGAFTGGVIALSCLLGREQPTAGLKDFAAVTKAYRKRFLETFGELTCHAILAKHQQQENLNGCIHLTAQAAVVVCGLLHDLEGRRTDPCGGIATEMIGQGQCPFGGCAC